MLESRTIRRPQNPGASLAASGPKRGHAVLTVSSRFMIQGDIRTRQHLVSQVNPCVFAGGLRMRRRLIALSMSVFFMSSAFAGPKEEALAVLDQWTKAFA